jgi:transposase-like protein
MVPTLLDTSQPYKMAIGEVNMSNKRYTEEFKMEAVRQVVDRGYSVAEVADRLDTTTHSLYAWKKKYDPDSAEHQVKTETDQTNLHPGE